MDSLFQSIRSFQFVQNGTPLCRFQDAAAVCALYFIVINALPRYMQNRKAFEIRTIIVVHNMILTAASTLLLLCFSLILVEKSFKYTPFEMICSPEFHADGRLHALYFLNYLLKWYELLDTVFLVLRKREVIFLHSYHHAATLFLCWIQMDQHSTVQWVPITLNLLVHVFMYYYYTLAAMGIRLWWKKYLTQLQIAQFVIDIVACVYASSHEPVVSALGLGYLKRPYCHGTFPGAASGVGILSSYLLLFLAFYAWTYGEAKKPPAAAAKAPPAGDKPNTRSRAAGYTDKSD